MSLAILVPASVSSFVGTGKSRKREAVVESVSIEIKEMTDGFVFDRYYVIDVRGILVYLTEDVARDMAIAILRQTGKRPTTYSD